MTTWSYVLVVGGLLILVAAWIVVQFTNQFWGFYLGLAGAAIGYIGARLYLAKKH